MDNNQTTSHYTLKSHFIHNFKRVSINQQILTLSVLCRLDNLNLQSVSFNYSVPFISFYYVTCDANYLYCIDKLDICVQASDMLQLLFNFILGALVVISPSTLSAVKDLQSPDSDLTLNTLCPETLIVKGEAYNCLFAFFHLVEKSMW